MGGGCEVWGERGGVLESGGAPGGGLCRVERCFVADPHHN